jgi:hypothetical protein
MKVAFEVEIYLKINDHIPDVGKKVTDGAIRSF